MSRRPTDLARLCWSDLTSPTFTLPHKYCCTDNPSKLNFPNSGNHYSQLSKPLLQAQDKRKKELYIPIFASNELARMFWSDHTGPTFTFPYRYCCITDNKFNFPNLRIHSQVTKPIFSAQDKWKKGMWGNPRHCWSRDEYAELKYWHWTGKRIRVKFFTRKYVLK